MNKTVLSFLAHPDDAEFLRRNAGPGRQAGWEIHIATATPGDCGTMTQDRWSISATRTAEATRSARLIDATFRCLDERDVTVVYDKPTLRKTVDLFRQVGPSLVFTHASKDYMMDHEMVSLLARAASFADRAPN